MMLWWLVVVYTVTADYTIGWSQVNTSHSKLNCPLTGTVPSWLKGKLFRQSAATFGPLTTDKLHGRITHLFDGLGMVVSYGINSSGVSYSNRPMTSKAYDIFSAADHDVEKSRVSWATVWTEVDQLRLLENKVRFPKSMASNPNVNVWYVPVSGKEGQLLSVTEGPHQSVLDCDTLTVDHDMKWADTNLGFDPRTHFLLTTPAHEHMTKDGSLWNVYLMMENTTTEGSVKFVLFRTVPNTLRREVVGSATLGPWQLKDCPAFGGHGTPLSSQPGYMHSFATTEQYAVLVENPWVFDPCKLMFDGSGFPKKYTPFFRLWEWRPERGNRVTVLSKKDGTVVTTFSVEGHSAFFVWHHANAYETTNSDGVSSLVLDFMGYPNATDAAMLPTIDELNKGNTGAVGTPMRLVIKLPTGEHTLTTLLPIDPTLSLEMPSVSPLVHQLPHRYLYGVKNIFGKDNSGVVKVDVGVNPATLKVWECDRCIPGEPVFRPRPGGVQEDDGVLLSVVVDTIHQISFMVVLEATNLTEIARAMSPVVPYGLHSRFFDC